MSELLSFAFISRYYKIELIHHVRRTTTKIGGVWEKEGGTVRNLQH